METLPKYGNITLFLGSLGLSIQSMKDTKIKDNLIDLQQKYLKQSETLNKVMIENEQLSKTLEDNFVKSSDPLREAIRKSLYKISTAANKISNPLGENINQNSEAIDPLNEILTEQTRINSILDKYSELASTISKSTNNKLLEDINETINKTFNFISNLSPEHLNAVVHISGSISIFYCLIAIIFAVFGDKLITNLNLENKFPKLAKIIKLRRKLFEVTLMWNIFLILVIISLIIYLNVLILIYN